MGGSWDRSDLFVFGSHRKRLRHWEQVLERTDPPCAYRKISTVELGVLIFCF
jgi:hypothetical protein